MPAAAVAMQQVSKRAIDHRSYHLQSKGPSTLVRIRVRFAIRFHARFARKPGRDPIFYLTLITYNGRSTPISKKNKKSLVGYHWQQIVHRIVHRFVREIARVDGP
jgi:hypothetical protein